MSQANVPPARSAASSPVRIGIVGAGSQGQYLLRRLLRVPGAVCAAACDILDANLNAAQQMVQLPETALYSDYRALLERTDLDAVLIATPPTLHAPITIAALESGRHVFCEKLMAATIDDALAMAQSAKKTGKILQIGHQRASSPGYQHARHLLQHDRVCGRVTHVRAQWNRNGSWRRSLPEQARILQDKADWSDAEHLVNWRLYQRTSAGLMAELGSHQIQVVNWFLGESPCAVMGVGGVNYWRDGRDVWDNVQCIFEYPSGVILTYQSLTTNQFDGFQEEFMGDAGTLITTVGEDNRDKGWLYREPTAEVLEWTEIAPKEAGIGGKPGIVLNASATKKWQTGSHLEEQALTTETDDRDAYELQFHNWIASIRDGAPVHCDAQEAFKTTVATLKANEAIAQKTRLEIPAALYEIPD